MNDTPKYPQDKTFAQLQAEKGQTDDNVAYIRSNPEMDSIQPMTSKEILQSNPAELEYALYPWLPMQGMAIVYAATGVGKTLFALNCAYAIAGGGNFLKYAAPTPRRVLYVDGEMAYVQIYNRFKDIAAQQGELIKDNLLLLTPEKSAFPLPKLETREGQEFYAKKIKEHQIDVIVFDNFSALSTINFNNQHEWAVIQDWLVKLRSAGVTSMSVHHAGKDKFGYRGTSGMLDCMDTAISLQPVVSNELEEETTKSHKFKVVYDKNRTFSGQDALPFEALLSQDGWKHLSLELTNTQRIVEMYSELKMKVPDIALELNISKSYIYRLIKKCKLKSPD